MISAGNAPVTGDTAVTDTSSPWWGGLAEHGTIVDSLAHHWVCNIHQRNIFLLRKVKTHAVALASTLYYCKSLTADRDTCKVLAISLFTINEGSHWVCCLYS